MDVVVTDQSVVVYRKDATITVRLDNHYDYLVAVNRHDNTPTETIPRRP